MKVVYCDKCSSRQSDADVESGRTVLHNGKYYCPGCARELGIAQEDDAPLMTFPGKKNRKSKRLVLDRPQKYSKAKMRRKTGSTGKSGSLLLAAGFVLLILTVVIAYFAIRQPETSVGSEYSPASPVPEEHTEKTDVQVPENRNSSNAPGNSTESPKVTGPGFLAHKMEKPVVPTTRHSGKTPEEIEAGKAEEKPSGDWIDLFDGVSLKGWERHGGKAEVKDGCIVLDNAADLLCTRRWKKYEIEMELKGEFVAEHGDVSNIALVTLGQTRDGRGNATLSFYFCNDGDVHVRSSVNDSINVKLGAHTFEIRDWIKVRLSYNGKWGRIYKGERLLREIRVKNASQWRTAVMLCGYSTATRVYFRNIRVRQLEP